MKLTDLQTTEERLNLLEKTAEKFADRAQEYDEKGAFPFANFVELKAIHYPALTVPKKYGGLAISLVEMLKMQETIAKYDGSTALSIGWHMGITKHLGEAGAWEEATYEAFAKDVVETGALLNNAATEPATGSPTRGGKPETFAKATTDGWIINGRKSFTTLSPILDYFVVSASIDGTEKVGNFLVRRGLDGVSVAETWDSIAMKATGSHDLVLENVKLKKEDLVQYITPGDKAAQGWLLHIPACYLGIAKAAQTYAVDFATTYSPSSIKGTISDFPAVRQKIGEMELRILESNAFLYTVAKKWDENDEETRQSMKPELGAVKLSIVNNALETVDLAMRIVGARSLSAKCPLQRYYRDVRAGLHNPPMDDMTIMALAANSIEKLT
ncbi:acyl-CoA dehydrogenase family protein [Pseudogracilibacillus auburnensis]|uniref:acyl-CoA dehydrogenase family protein n=1 Tax=Pseudogracilibacillus auburnensis TaxID=1494959 RepID=UPI001A96CA6F|nr:acyl-CoA dehydrogenase family protein [Pseudogracilibacillus auburnensis]MBO1004888.1 acyl-CoA/acyl-ACP dehydrogenase [Pseudogracilibacillus auburnensis]